MSLEVTHTELPGHVDAGEIAPESRGEDVIARLARLVVDDRATLLAFLRRRTGSLDEAEEVMQIGVLRAVEALGSLRDPARIRPWFYRILRRLIADRHAARRAEVARLFAHADGADTFDDIAGEAASPREVATCACSLGLLARLSEPYRDVVQRVDVDEQPLADVARALGITPNNATVRLHRARRALRTELLRMCGTRSMRSCLDCECDA